MQEEEVVFKQCANNEIDKALLSDTSQDDRIKILESKLEIVCKYGGAKKIFIKTIIYFMIQ